MCFRASPTAYGSSQARGRIRAVAAGLHHSHSNTESKPGLRAPPQLTAILDSRPTEQGQGLNPHPHGYELDSFLLSHKGNSLYSFCFGSQPPTLAQMRKGPFLSSPPIIPWSSSLLLSAYFPSFHYNPPLSHGNLSTAHPSSSPCYSLPKAEGNRPTYSEQLQPTDLR